MHSVRGDWSTLPLPAHVRLAPAVRTWVQVEMASRRMVRRMDLVGEYMVPRLLALAYGEPAVLLMVFMAPVIHHQVFLVFQPLDMLMAEECLDMITAMEAMAFWDTERGEWDMER